MVEFALVLPLVLLIVVGIFKFGVAFNHYVTLTDAVRSGARQLAVERGQGDPCGDAVQSVNRAADPSLDTSQLTITITANILVPGDTYSSTTGSGPCALSSGDGAKVIATYPCEASILGIDFAPGCNLTASATERTE